MTFNQLYKDINNIKSNNTQINYFKHNGVEYIFIGEAHSGLKKDISSLIDKSNNKILSIVECHMDMNKLPIGKISSHYKKKVKEDKKIKNESYIDLHINHYSNKYKSLFNKNKELKEVIKKQKVKLVCVDGRKPSDFPKTQVRTLYKKDIKKYNEIKSKFLKLKNKISKMKESKTKKALLKEINDIIDNKLKEKSSYLLQTLSEIILDYEILNNYILNDKIKSKYVIGIFGKNHVNNIKKYFKI